MKKYIPFAILYDFDGTLAPGNMQERDFIPAVKMKTKKFWKEVNNYAKKNQADSILIYMKQMLDKAKQASIKVREHDFQAYGKNIEFFEGVLPYKHNDIEEDGWFDRINNYGRASKVKVEHFIVSSGIREMIFGTPIAKKFKAIYASSFCYDHYGIAVWPAMAINYTTKTQFIFRINKGCLDVSDNDEINKYIPEKERSIPFKNMVYIGDGFTDVPCFRLVKVRGGHSIAVYKPHTRGEKEKTMPLIEEGRVNYIAPADYKNKGLIDRIIKGLIDKIASDEYLYNIR